jgi:ribosomal protein L40E
MIGVPVSMPTKTATSSATKVILGCSKCGAILPDEAQFCLQCGKPVALPAKEPVKGEESAVQLAPPRIRKRRILLWVLLGLLLGATLWAATSESPFAQGIQELVGWKHDQTVLETPFSVTAHSFRYYKFGLPEGSVNVSIIGQFSSSSEKKKAAVQSKDADADDNDIEVYVLSEPAFAVWQNGYATSSVYESGRVSQGSMQAELPAGAGVYYLVFSNKFSSTPVKNVNATVLLRYKSWLPDSFRRMKERFWNWIGL